MAVLEKEEAESPKTKVVKGLASVVRPRPQFVLRQQRSQLVVGDVHYSRTVLKVKARSNAASNMSVKELCLD